MESINFKACGLVDKFTERGRERKRERQTDSHTIRRTVSERDRQIEIQRQGKKGKDRCRQKDR